MNCQIKKEGGLIPLWHCVKMVVQIFAGYNIDRHKESCIYGKLKVAKWLYN